jgi:hypothetical protein
VSTPHLGWWEMARSPGSRVTRWRCKYGYTAAIIDVRVE